MSPCFVLHRPFMSGGMGTWKKLVFNDLKWIGRSVFPAAQGRWMCMCLCCCCFLGFCVRRATKDTLSRCYMNSNAHCRRSRCQWRMCGVGISSIHCLRGLITFLSGNPWCLGLASSGHREAPSHMVGNDMRMQGRSGHQPPWHLHWFSFVGRSSFGSRSFHTYCMTGQGNFSTLSSCLSLSLTPYLEFASGTVAPDLHGAKRWLVISDQLRMVLEI